MDGKDNDDDGLIDEDHDKVGFDRLIKEMNAILILHFIFHFGQVQNSVE